MNLSNNYSIFPNRKGFVDDKWYLSRICCSLQVFEMVTLYAYGNNCHALSKIVLQLKDNEIGTIKNTETQLIDGAVPALTTTIKRGKLGACLQNYRQRKVIKLFEKLIQDEVDVKDNNGSYIYNNAKDTFELGIEHLRSLNFPKRLNCGKFLINECDKWLNGHYDDGYVNLPKFIKYMSIAVNPRLTDHKFEQLMNSLFEMPKENEKSMVIAHSAINM